MWSLRRRGSFEWTLAPGDDVDVTYTEPVAVEMHPVP
jgi:hypothetical protein